MSRLASSVTAVEVEPELVAAASANLAALGIGNATVVEGALTEGAPDAAPFDVIFINGSIVDVPTGLPAQLKDGGRLVAIVAGGEGRPGQPKASLFVKVEGETSGVSTSMPTPSRYRDLRQAACFTL